MNVNVTQLFQLSELPNALSDLLNKFQSMGALFIRNIFLRVNAKVAKVVFKEF